MSYHPTVSNLQLVLTTSVKYVALLAFNKIVQTHPYLVAQQEDVILECIDSPDISIRIKALDLVGGMVSSENLVSIVSRLMKQLRSSSPARERQQRERLSAQNQQTILRMRQNLLSTPMPRTTASPLCPTTTALM